MTVAINVFRVLASCTSITMILSPIPTILKIHRAKDTGHASILPLVAMFDNCHVVMMFGYLTKQYFPVFSTFVFGDIFSLIYVATFYRYTHEKARARRIMAAVGIPLLLVTVYSFLGGYGVTGQTRRVAGNFVGYYSILAALLLYAAPLEKVGQVLKHRSAVFLPIHMICAGTTNNLMWVCYGALTKEWLIFAPNCASLFFGVIQIALYLVFHPSTHPLQAPAQPHTLAEEFEMELEMGSPTPRNTLEAKLTSSFVRLESPLEHLPTQAKTTV